MARQKDRVAVCNILPLLVHCENERAYDDTFLHSLISYLISMAEEFAMEDFCVAVFDDFILVRQTFFVYTIVIRYVNVRNSLPRIS